MEKRERKIMNTKIGQEIKKKRIYLNDVQFTIACIKDTYSKYIWSKLIKEYEVRTI